MNWSKTDAEKAIAEYESLYESIKVIATKLESLKSGSDDKCLSSDLQLVWNTYIRDFETGKTDMDSVILFVIC